MMKQKRIENKAFLRSFHSMKCVCCGALGCDPAHIKTRGSGGDDDETNVIPLCRECHTEQGKIGIATFVMKHSTVEEHLERLGWTVVFIFGVHKLVRKLPWSNK